MIFHEFSGGHERPVAHASRSLAPSKSRSIVKLFRFFFGVKKLDQYLRGRKFTKVTNNSAVLPIMKPDKPVHVIAKLQRWVVILGSFDYDVS